MTESNEETEIKHLSDNNNPGTNPDHSFSKKKILTTFLVLGLIIILATGVFIVIKDKPLSTSKSCNSRDEGSVLFNANKVFKENTVAVTKEQIDNLVEQVKTVDGYENEANCLYPIMFSYIHEGNYQTASDEYAKFAKVYGSGENFANDIYPLNNIDELKNLIDFSVKNSPNVNKTPNGVIMMGEPIPPEAERVSQ